ncbi:MAG: hypothetical protein KF819_20455 [Labilithrix sp.]|nr:hypothetical protein [Labilithrix sp.]
MTKRRLFALLVVTMLLVGLGVSSFACSQTPTSVPVRTFERAQRMDVACLQIYDPNTYEPHAPVGVSPESCRPTPSFTNGDFVEQLYGFVTQSARGEVAVVNLSAGVLVDINRATPGINFLPVGALPTDIAATPDGRMVFVASAEPNKAAIYGIPTRRVLGDQRATPDDPEPVSLASWPVCVLPQNPGALAIVPRRGAPLPVPADAGAGDGGGAGADAGAPEALEYELVAVLPGDRRNSAKLVTIDTRPFRRGGLPRNADGTPSYASAGTYDPTLTEGPFLAPGVPAACPITSAVELAGEAAVPKAVFAGAAWSDGVKYVEGGVDTTCDRPVRGSHCGLPPCCAPPPAPVEDAGTPGDGGDGGDAAPPPPIPPPTTACEPLGPKDAGEIPLDLPTLDPPRLVSVVRDDQTLYVADEGVPLIHVVDMSTPGAPKEIEPLVATSLGDPSRVVKIKELAISPPTRDYKRFLYAVDRIEGSIMVFDVTDPLTMPRTPMTRPHPELNPFQPIDRISFSNPVVAVAFARHDWPLARMGGGVEPNTTSGALCNPNPNLDANPQADPGFYYRAGSSDPGRDIGARRLRGIFAFATLANGQVIVIDVDDWDSPCRRPQDMSAAISAIAPAQPRPLDSAPLDPYHAPLAADLATTNELFFPMASPHTARSEVLVLATTSGTGTSQGPRISGAPVISANNLVLPTTGPDSANTPLLTATFGMEDPHAHIDQDWIAQWEGALPGFEGISATIGTTDAYASLVLSQAQGRFCGKGVEDWSRGMDRVAAMNAELARLGRTPLPPGSDRLVTDYIQLTEEILPADDAYWGLDDAPANECWQYDEGRQRLPAGGARHDACVRTFGAADDQSTQRDFPILEAYEDKLVVGRFYPRADGKREVVWKDKSSADVLKLMRCCFHHQVRFRVRTAQTWALVGKNPGGAPGVGFLSHLTADPAGRCVPTCDPRESLLNGRIPTIDPVFRAQTVNRNSPLVMRNPMFAVQIAGGEDRADPLRDTTYSFPTRGAFRTLLVNVAGTSTAVNPQSMRFIDVLGQMGIVDAASQGLVLIDLRGVTIARAPYF